MPPVIVVGQIQISGLVFGIMHQVLFDVFQDHCQLFTVTDVVQGHSVHCLGIDRQLIAIAVKIGPHIFALQIFIHQYHVYHGIQGVGIGQTADGQPCVLILATVPAEELAGAVPDSLEGWPVRIDSGDEIRPLN